MLITLVLGACAQPTPEPTVELPAIPTEEPAEEPAGEPTEEPLVFMGPLLCPSLASD